MKTLSIRVGTLLLVTLTLAACGRHPEQTAAQVQRRAPDAAAAIAVKPGAAPAASSERAVEITEETEGAADVPAGLSPIAAAVAAATPAAAVAIPAKWTEGKSYTSLVPAQPTSVAPDKVEVVEVFWYGCGHCFHLDPLLEGWRKQGKPAFVEFVRVPVMWNEVTRAHARLFYTLEALDKLEQLHTAVFREIHVNSHYLFDADPARTEQLHRAFLKANGVSEADFDRTYRSFSVESKLQRAEQLTRRYKVTGVPLMVVNGKYTADVGTAGGETQLLELVDDLAASEHKR
ncbi:MAG TPA: thiol:disulfide interchange protein DsbA/DsbL [Steroidobacteraceae bacterium]|nr:thiol:disulfide interchange protein DsbA/DsbL [Steroidobacteraceae bacterium]